MASSAAWFVCTLLPSTAPAQPAGMETKTIAIARDGDSWFLDWLIEHFQNELALIADGQYDILYKDTFNAEWDQDRIDEVLAAALADAEVDLIYAAGPFMTRHAASITDAQRTKPIFAGTPRLADASDFPISEEGTSLLKNFGFICSPRRIGADMELVLGLSGADTVYCIVDAELLRNFDATEKFVVNMREKLSAELEFVPGIDDVESCVSAIPADAKAVYVSIMPRMDRTRQRALYARLREKALLNVSMLGHYGVSLGAMAGLEPLRDKAIGRRSALSVHELLLGVPAEKLPVYLPVQDQLLINRAAARAIGYSPSYEIWLGAGFINEDFLDTGESLSLEQAMTLAAEQNAAVIAARENLHIAGEDIRLARSALLPQWELSGQHQRREVVDPIQTETPAWDHGGSYGTEWKQLLFSDVRWTDFRAAKRAADSARYNTESTELDAKEAAAWRS